MQPNNQLDSSAVNLAKAIRQTESGGNFKAQGKSGEYGAYQFTEPTWNTYASKHGVNVPLNQATPEQQNEVAYKQIKEWKDSGMNVGQVASMWNSGKPDAYNDPSYKGVNKQGVPFDVPAYAKSVATAYQTLKNGGQVHVDPNNPSSVNAPKYPFTESNNQNAPTSTEDNSKPRTVQGMIQGAVSPFLKVAASGEALYNSGKGLIKSVLGQDTSNEQAQQEKLQNEGTDFGLPYFGKNTPVGSVKGGIHSVKDFGKGVLDAVKTGGEIGVSTAGGAGLIKSVTKAGSLARILANPSVKTALESVVTKQGLSQLTTEKDIFNALSEAIKVADPYTKIELSKQLQKVLAPSVLSKIPGLIWKGTVATGRTVGLGELYRGGQDIKNFFGSK